MANTHHYNNTLNSLPFPVIREHCDDPFADFITYTDPRDGTQYTYLTNELTLPAFQLVIIYKCRWDIEKAFGERV